MQMYPAIYVEQSLSVVANQEANDTKTRQIDVEPAGHKKTKEKRRCLKWETILLNRLVNKISIKARPAKISKNFT
jgi:hypothetical protein